MSQAIDLGNKPQIVVSQDDHEKLMDLAEAAMQRAPAVAEELLAEMDRADVLPVTDLPANVIRMGTTLTYSADDQKRRVTLVFPADADIAQGRISILTPVGAALIGLSEGQSIRWTARDGRVHTLTIESVEPPEA